MPRAAAPSCRNANLSSPAASDEAMQSWWMLMTDTDTVMELRETPVPQPASNQLLVRMHAAALNRVNTWSAMACTQGRHVEGHRGEGAGEVVAVGDGVTVFRAGDRIMGRCAGAFAEYALMEQAEAIAVPPTLSWEQAAGIP